MKGGIAAVIALVVVVRVGVVVASWEGCALLAGRGIMASFAPESMTLALPWDLEVAPARKCRPAGFSLHGKGARKDVDEAQLVLWRDSNVGEVRTRQQRAARSSQIVNHFKPWTLYCHFSTISKTLRKPGVYHFHVFAFLAVVSALNKLVDCRRDIIVTL